MMRKKKPKARLESATRWFTAIVVGCALALPGAAHDDGSFGACVEKNKSACEDLAHGDFVTLCAMIVKLCYEDTEPSAAAEETGTDETETER